MPVSTTAPPASCAAESVSSSHTQATTDASTTSTIATIETRVAGRWWSAPRESANGTIVPRTIIQSERSQTGAVVDSNAPWSDTDSQSSSNGKPHQGCTTAQNRCRDTERDAREGKRVPAGGHVLAGEEVRRQRARGKEPGGDADGVEPRVLPHLRDEREPCEREREGRPDPATDVLVPHHPRPEGDEDGRRELEQQADPDREALDRDEVEPRDEREPDDAVEEQQADLVPADPEAAGRRQRDEGREPQERARHAELREPQARHVGRGEDDLRDRPVDREQARRRGRHRVSEPRVPGRRERLVVEDDLRHRARLSAVRGRAGEELCAAGRRLPPRGV